MYMSADPSLCLGRGGAWDHRRCGTLADLFRRNSTAIWFYSPSRLPFASLSKLKRIRSSFHKPFGPQPSFITGFPDCHLPALKCRESSAAPPTAI